MNRRRIHRSFLRLLVSFGSITLFCSLFVFYGNYHVIKGLHETRDSYIGLPRRIPSREKHSLSNPLSQRAIIFSSKDKRRALQGFFELKNGSPELKITDLTTAVQANVYIGCEDIRETKILGEVGHGYTKSVQKGFIKEAEVAVKSVLESSKDVQRCLNSEVNYTKAECYNLIKYKLAKEILLLQQLKHINIISLLGFCWQNEVNSNNIKERGLTMITELGQPIDVLSLLQLPWQERLRICLGLARLILYLEHSPVGSLIIRDFKHNQFVLVSGEIKLTDLDDLDNEERPCVSSEQCIVGTQTVNWTALPCVSGKCLGFNPAFNMFNIRRYFLDHILVPEAPGKVRIDLQDILIQAQNSRWSSRLLVKRLEDVVRTLRTGNHMTFDPAVHTHDYNIIPEADFPALHDYACGETRSMTSCELAVYSLEEAKYECNQDPRCKAFVVTRFKTWVGFTIIYLKNDSTGVRYSKDTSVFLKIQR
ncbi:extracellular tyrosine-protein kinase PKDCC-like [Actinia tenebrosa]|uniref:Extracellular tyrosine-protein kinase PKDCC-like n=1 Tax=Actinia tenebrosa TaxID=6105 RepID=A0A6P8HZ05_ACTTE|nr:extracellular tyrosine-protein kinase PKDCC-like [Actinia tenebrosa]